MQIARNPSVQAPVPHALPYDLRGVAVVEFALVAPLFLVMLLGILAYGGYFWRAHSLQQIANDAARASIAGLTATERASLARATVSGEVADLAGLSPDRATVGVREDGDTLSVSVAYDAHRDAFFQFGLVPMPDPVIRRDAAIKLGGL